MRSCDDVPAWARISDISPVFYHVERKAVLTYSRSGIEHDLARQTIEEVVEW